MADDFIEKAVEVDGYPVKSYFSRNYRPLKLLLLNKYGVCFWCGIKVRDYGNVDRKMPPSDMATIDHIKQRPERKKNEVVGKVLACYRCNNKRNEDTQKSLSQDNIKNL